MKHGAAEDDVTTKQIARTVARGLDLPATSLPAELVAERVGPFAPFMELNFTTCPN